MIVVTPQRFYTIKGDNVGNTLGMALGTKEGFAVVILMLRTVLEPLVVRTLSHPHTAAREWFQVSLGFGGCVLFSIVLMGWIAESQQ